MPAAASVNSNAWPQYHRSRPTDLRRMRPWHRLAYIIWLLPRRLATLATMLEVPADGRLLDYGCAERPYRRFFDQRVGFVGADLPGNPDADIEIAPDGTVPVPDGSYDAVLSTQVIEHVADPAIYLSECCRVLRPGGRMLLSTHGMMVYHPDPVDFWRWTGAGLRRQIEDAGLRVMHAEGIMGLTAVGIQFVQDGIYWRMPQRVRPLVALVFQSLVALADRLDSAQDRASNAMVFAVIAETPVGAIK